MNRIIATVCFVGLAAISLFITACNQQHQQSPYEGSGKVVANINGVKITDDRLDLIIQALPPNAQGQFQTDEGKRNLIDQLTTQKLLIQYAKDKGMDQDPLFQVRRQIMNDELLLNSVYQEITEEHPADDEALIKFYQTHPEVMGAKAQYTARHILVSPTPASPDQPVSNTTGDDAGTDEEALQKMAMLQEKLNAGADFAELAKQYSEGPSAPRGGDLGTFKAGDMVPEFDQALERMEPGQVSDIVKTRFGYHLIYLSDRGMTKRPDFGELNAQQKEQVKAYYYRNIINTMVEDLKKNAVVEVNL